MSEGGEPKEQDQHAPPVLRAELQVPQAAIDAYNAGQDKQQRLERWKFVVEVLTLVVVVAYAGITCKMWRANEKAATAAKLAADAASQSNSIAAQAMENTTRAWLVPKPPDYMDFQCPPIRVEITIGNVGSAPAFNVLSKTDWGGSPEELPSTIPKAEGEWGGVPAFVAPGPHYGITVAAISAPLDEAVCRLIREGRQPLYVGGIIRYDDPTGRDRETVWCVQYRPTTRDFAFCGRSRMK